MSKHTPGPWEGKENEGVFCLSGKAVFETGCNCCTSNELSSADARLIAAAPDLLETLEKIARMDYGNPYASDCANAARAAIAKATGDQQ